jgi:hypothetical protein
MLDEKMISLHDGIVQEADPLKLELEDSEFIQVINQSIADSVSHYKTKQLPQRQEKMLNYYLGNQLKIGGEDGLAGWQTKYVENIVYEGIRRIKPIATSRLPDLTVKSAQDPQSGETLTKVLNTDIKKRGNRKLLGLAHVHEQLFLYAVLKGRWNPEKGDDGDYEFINIFPRNIVWDHTCKTSDVDDMRFVAENAELTVKEVMMMFPKTADKLLGKLGYSPEDKVNELKLATKINIWEVWFHWYKSTQDPVTQQTKWEKVHAVVWKYDDVVLGKMRNPYFDYEGKPHLYDPAMKEKNGMSEDEMFQAFLGNTQLGQDTIYYNYFRNPRKPYYFMVYESLGQDPIDATNRVEQILSFQDHINDEGRQIIEMNERSAGKPIFNADAIDKDTVKTLDWRNTRQALSVNGDDITKAFTHATMPAAPSQLYTSKTENRNIGFEMLGVGAVTRGVSQSRMTMGEAQMLREQDLGFIDDLVEDTINGAAEWQAQWSMQFIKLFYTKDHLREVVGKDGESLYTAINQDTVTDGMVVEVSASGVDKMLRKQLAVQNMQMGVGDLLSYYEDTDQSNPQERAYRAFLQTNSPMVYAQQYLLPENQQNVAGPVQPGQPGQPGQPAGAIIPGMPTPDSASAIQSAPMQSSPFVST